MLRNRLIKPSRHLLLAGLLLGLVFVINDSPATAASAKRPAKGKAKSSSQKPTQHSTSSVTFSGQAAVVAFGDAAINQQLVLGLTAQLPGTGGNVSAAVVSTNIASNPITETFALQAGEASTVGANNVTRSRATVENFAVTVLATNLTVHTIAFNQLQVEASAQATASGVVTTGSTTINGLTLDGVAVNVTGEANQVVAFSGGTLTINAQNASVSRNQGQITVSGLFIFVEGCMNGAVGMAQAGISVSGTVPPPTSRVEVSGAAAVTVLTHLEVGDSVIIGQTGELLSGGGSLAITLGPTNITANGASNALVFQSAEALTSGATNESHSEVTINNFSVILRATNGTLHTISFNNLHVEANATLTATGVVTVGTTTISGLVIDNVAVNVTGEVNQTITLDGLTVVINGQTVVHSGTHAEISVSGIFISLTGCMQGPIGFARAGITITGGGGVGGGGPGGGHGGGPGPGPGAQCDKLTGGGFILGTPSGAHGSFGVSGGIRRGQFWGHLNYIDHGTGMHVRSTAVTGYTNMGGNTRKIDYMVDVDGAAGTCTVLATDNGEPGRDDRFDITVSNGYHAGGDLGGSGSGGGNIQLHKCPPGWLK